MSDWDGGVVLGGMVVAVDVVVVGITSGFVVERLAVTVEVEVGEVKVEAVCVEVARLVGGKEVP